MKKNTLIQVTWNDILDECGWVKEKEIDEELFECTTLGFFFKCTDKQLILSGTIAVDGQRNFTKIPLGCIENIRVLSIGNRVRNI